MFIPSSCMEPESTNVAGRDKASSAHTLKDCGFCHDMRVKPSLHMPQDYMFEVTEDAYK